MATTYPAGILPLRYHRLLLCTVVGVCPVMISMAATTVRPSPCLYVRLFSPLAGASLPPIPPSSTEDRPPPPRSKGHFAGGTPPRQQRKRPRLWSITGGSPSSSTSDHEARNGSSTETLCGFAESGETGCGCDGLSTRSTSVDGDRGQNLAHPPSAQRGDRFPSTAVLCRCASSDVEPSVTEERSQEHLIEREGSSSGSLRGDACSNSNSTPPEVRDGKEKRSTAAGGAPATGRDRVDNGERISGQRLLFPRKKGATGGVDHGARGARSEEGKRQERPRDIRREEETTLNAEHSRQQNQAVRVVVHEVGLLPW